MPLEPLITEDLLQQLASQPDIDKSTLIQIIHNLAERIDRLETKKPGSITKNIPPPKESYTEFIHHIQIPKLDSYLTDLPKLLSQIITDWLNRDKPPIFLFNKKTQLYIYITEWRLFTNTDLIHLYNYIVKQITIQLSKWQTEQQDNIVQNERLCDTYSIFITDILSTKSNKKNYIKSLIAKEMIKNLQLTKTPS